MSDPMTNVEIEDVLSSIRRLVSEDHRPTYKTPEGQTPAGKLVLTPALRIVPQAEPPLEPGTPAADEAFPSRAEVFSSVRARGRSDADLLSEPRFGFDVVSHEAAATVLEAALSNRTDDWEPDGSEMAASSLDWTIEWDLENTGADIAVEAETPIGGEAEAVTDDEAMIEWHDDSPAGMGGPDPDEAPYMEADPDTETFSVLEEDEDTLIDEETLREIVRDIIREELQGGLGERITRNVRKLVRAEIAQALATRDFE